MKKFIYLVTLLVTLLSLPAWADAFVVERIQIDGLQRISPATVESYLPIRRGQTLKPGKSADILRALYKTGFFDKITLSTVDGTLIIHVVERPTIGQLKIKGNSVVTTEKLTTVMKSLNIAEGRVYDPAILEKIKKSLLNQYYQLGYYNARVDITATSMVRNRVLVTIQISEGLVSKIRRISIIGNHAFSEKVLIKHLEITTATLISFITQSDRYSEERLEASNEKLRGFYLDHGYVRFEMKSAQAQVTPDRKSVYVSMVISEGQPYTIERYEINGKLPVPRSEFDKLIGIKPGDVFSRQKIMDGEKKITKMLGDKGYMFANIGLRPRINDQTHKVILIFDIQPGKRAYVRHVTFSDNNRTNDVVLRREVTQWESAPASTSKLDESKHRLSLLPFIREVDMSVKPVPGTDDNVDIDYKVKENNSAEATFKVGYSQVYRTIFGAGLNQKNFFGTGNTLGINLTRSNYEQYYGIDYTDPYYTPDGISRTFNLSLSRVNPSAISTVNNGYTTNEYDFGVLYGIPVGQEEGVFNRVQAGLGYQNILVSLIPGKVSNQVNNFVNDHGRHFQEADFKLGYSRDSRDKAIFPTTGAFQTLFFDAYAPLASQSLAFYTMNYHAKWYQSLTDQFILLTKADLGYGNGLHGVQEYPFFRNYFVGGIDSVRGYQTNGLGPLDSNGQALGGNMLVDGSLGLIFPNYISENLRTTVFVDAGNVYTSFNNQGYGGGSRNPGPVRFSIGIEADVLTPFGPIEVSVAKPINKQRSQEQDIFQFSLGANF